MATGRHVAMRMAIVSAVWFILGLLLALIFKDLLFVVFGVAGAFGAGLSSIVAIMGEGVARAPRGAAAGGDDGSEDEGAALSDD